MNELMTANDLFLTKMEAARTRVGIHVRKKIKATRTTRVRTRPIASRFVAAINDVMSELTRLFAQKQHAMCDNYGHVIPDNWRGNLPTCTECGVVIKSARDLRRAHADGPTPEKRTVWVYDTFGRIVQQTFD